MNVKNIVSKLVSCVFPITCSSCGKDLPPGAIERVCQDCFKGFKKNDGLVCAKCGVFLADGGEHCFECRRDKRRFSFDLLRSPYIYDGNVRKLILKFKYSDRMFIAKEFASDMSEAAVKNDFNIYADYIVPVPLNILRRAKRGYNQAEILAAVLSKEISKPVLTNVLYRKKITKPQFKLSKRERAENMKSSFLIKNAELVKSKNILLIDDVATTGATLSACAKTLKSAGAKKVFALTLARDV